MAKWSIKNIDEIKGASKTPTLVRLTKAQWTRAARSLPEGGALTEDGLRLIAIPDPDGDVIIYPSCPEEGPNTECMVRPMPSPGGVTYECRCRPRRRTPQPGGGGGLQRGTCSLSFNFNARPILRCTSVHCAGRCRLQIAIQNVAGHRMFVITCSCS